MTIAKLKKMSDRQVAVLLDTLISDAADSRDALICEAAYRLLRANKGCISNREERRLDRVAIGAYRRSRLPMKVAGGGAHPGGSRCVGSFGCRAWLRAD
jgi:hypothetical protein